MLGELESFQQRESDMTEEAKFIGFVLVLLAFVALVWAVKVKPDDKSFDFKSHNETLPPKRNKSLLQENYETHILNRYDMRNVSQRGRNRRHR